MSWSRTKVVQLQGENLHVAYLWTKFMTAISKFETALLHVLLQLGLVDVLGQPVGNVSLPMRFDDGQLFLVHLALNAQLSYFSVSDSPSTPPRRNAPRRTRISIHFNLHLRIKIAQ